MNGKDRAPEIQTARSDVQAVAGGSDVSDNIVEYFAIVGWKRVFFFDAGPLEETFGETQLTFTIFQLRKYFQTERIDGLAADVDCPFEL